MLLRLFILFILLLTRTNKDVNLYKHVKTKQSIHSHPAVIALAGVYIFHMPVLNWERPGCVNVVSDVDSYAVHFFYSLLGRVKLLANYLLTTRLETKKYV